MNKPKRILIVRTDRLGDLILSTPIIRNLRLYYPDSHIAFMCRPYTRQVLEGNPYLDEVIVYDKYESQRSFFSSLRFGLGLRIKKFDLALILHPTNRSHLVTFLAGIHKRVGWDKKLKFLLTDKLKHNKDQGKKHELEYNLDFLRYLGIPIEEKEIYFPLKEKENKRVDKILEKNNIDRKDKIVVVHPSASCPSKRWPQDRFIELIKMIAEAQKTKTIVITSADQKKFGEKIIKEIEAIDLRGILTISETASLLSKAALLISCDSGPVHIAAALRVPVISIFGRKQAGLSPQRWAPTGENSYFLHKDVGCKTCLAHNCQKGFLCLQAVKPTEVYALAKKFL
jgi:lipopolysaccharide heptosyltransferase II